MRSVELTMSNLLDDLSKATSIVSKLIISIFCGVLIVYLSAFMLGNAQIPLSPEYVYIIADGYASTYAVSSVHNLVRPQVVQTLAENITKGCETELCDVKMINKFMAMNFKYEKDEIRYRSREVWNPPEITLGRGVIGDCDDSAILIESLLENVVNESFMFLTTNHVYNVVCLSNKTIVLDQTSIWYGEDALNYINLEEPTEFYEANTRFWSKDWTKVSCLNVVEQEDLNTTEVIV